MRLPCLCVLRVFPLRPLWFLFLTLLYVLAFIEYVQSAENERVMQDDTTEKQSSSPAPGGRKQAPPDLVFYYSRERRLENASQAVRDLYEEGSSRRPGIIRSLTSTKAHVMLLMSIIMIVAAYTMITFFNRSGGKAVGMGGNTLTFSAAVFSGTTYMVVKKEAASNGRIYTGEVDIAVSPVLSSQERQDGVEAPIEASRIFFTAEPEEDFSFALPFEAAELQILIQTGEGRLALKIRPE